MDLISVLLPSRGRPSSLEESVASLTDLAAQPTRVEILVAADPDDEPTLRDAFLPVQASVRVAPERYGYARLHWYFNGLAEMATGEWLFLFNDDARLLTQDWDDVIRAEPPGILWPEADYASKINTFPVFPSAWARHLGHVSLDQSADMWWYELGVRTDTQRKIPVSVHHEHRTDDLTAAERDAVANVATFHTPEMVRARQADAARLREFLEGAS